MNPHLARLTMAPKEYMMANPVMLRVHSIGMDWEVGQENQISNHIAFCRIP